LATPAQAISNSINTEISTGPTRDAGKAKEPSTENGFVSQNEVGRNPPVNTQPLRVNLPAPAMSDADLLRIGPDHLRSDLASNTPEPSTENGFVSQNEVRRNPPVNTQPLRVNLPAPAMSDADLLRIGPDHLRSDLASNTPEPSSENGFVSQNEVRRNQPVNTQPLCDLRDPLRLRVHLPAPTMSDEDLPLIGPDHLRSDLASNTPEPSTENAFRKTPTGSRGQPKMASFRQPNRPLHTHRVD
jgi:hypothetical protein